MRCLVLLALISCAAHAPAADIAAVRRLTALEVPDPGDHSEHPDGPDPEVARLLEQELTPDSAVRVALLNNRALRADLSELGVPRGALLQARLVPNPEVEAEVRFPRNSDPPQWDLGLTFDLTRALLAGARGRVAEANVDVARCRAARAVLEVSYRARLALADVQTEARLLELERAALTAYAAGAEAARALHAAGNVPELDLVSEQAAYETARVSVAEAEARFVDARERLNVALGASGPQTAWSAPAGLPPAEPLEPADFTARALKASLELAEAEGRIEAQGRRLGLTEVEGLVPDLKVGMHAEHDGAVWEIGPAINVSLPLFDRRQGDVVSARAELEALRDRYVATAVSVHAAVRAAKNRVESASQRARRQADVVLPLRAKVLEQTLKQYNAMQVGVFRVLEARREQTLAQAAHALTLREYWRARAALEQLLAGRLVLPGEDR